MFFTIAQKSSTTALKTKLVSSSLLKQKKSAQRAIGSCNDFVKTYWNDTSCCDSCSSSSVEHFLPIFNKNGFVHASRLQGVPMRPSFAPIKVSSRTFATSTSSTASNQTSSEESSFRVLDADVISRIEADFQAVDANGDGRIDSDELRILLRRSGAFSDADIVEISEIFYAGRAGESVPFSNLLDAIDGAVANSGATADKAGRNSLGVGSCSAEYMYDPNHHVWSEEDLNVSLTHVEPKTFTDKAAFGLAKATRLLFDSATGWNGTITKEKVLQRVIFLETIAAVPGMVAGKAGRY